MKERFDKAIVMSGIYIYATGFEEEAATQCQLRFQAKSLQLLMESQNRDEAKQREQRGMISGKLQGR